MAHKSHGFSRRTFLLGVSGGAAFVSIAWGVSELELPVLGPREDSPITATLKAHAEYDGWLVTTEERTRLVLVEFTDGWHGRESGARSSWRWTQQTAGLSFRNPRTDAVLHLDYDARANRFRAQPRTLTITVGGQVAGTFILDAAGRQQIDVVLPESMLGGRDRIEVQLAVDRPIIPANSLDTRELGIQIYRAAVERSPTSTR